MKQELTELVTEIKAYLQDADELAQVERNKVYAAIRHRSMDVAAELTEDDYKDVCRLLAETRWRLRAAIDKSGIGQDYNSWVTAVAFSQRGDAEVIDAMLAWQSLTVLRWLLCIATNRYVPKETLMGVLATPVAQHIDFKLRQAAAMMLLL